jgi:hypothetical protein
MFPSTKLCGKALLEEANQSLFTLFFDNIHPWFPFLDREPWIAQHKNTFSQRFASPKSPAHALVLMVLGFGALSMDSCLEDRQAQLQAEANAAKYLEAAFSMFPEVIFTVDFTAVQCLILFG